jgi:hypothetical protein
LTAAAHGGTIATVFPVRHSRAASAVFHACLVAFGETRRPSPRQPPSLWSTTYASQGVQLVAVAEGWWSTTEADAAQWLTAAGVTFPAVFDPSPCSIGNSYGVGSVPRILIVDRAGIIRYDFLGVTECSVIQAALDQLLAESHVRFPKFVFSFGVPDRYIPRLLKVAYLIVNERSERYFQDFEVRTGKRFDAVVAGHLNAYLEKGTIPPEAISAPILNLADEYLAGKSMTLRAGDYVALQNYIRAGGK